MEKLRGQGVAYTYRIAGHNTFNFDFQMKTGGNACRSSYPSSRLSSRNARRRMSEIELLLRSSSSVAASLIIIQLFIVLITANTLYLTALALQHDAYHLAFVPFPLL